MWLLARVLSCVRFATAELRLIAIAAACQQAHKSLRCCFLLLLTTLFFFVIKCRVVYL
jgi:hypothetical protein